MSYQTMWFESEIPKEIVDIIENDVSKNFEYNMSSSILHGEILNKRKRNSKNSWIPTSHWVSGFIWHYVQRANKENFLYDITNIDNELIQFTKYEPGEFYNWHIDSGLSIHYKPQFMDGNHPEKYQDFINTNCESIRKLSVVVQLSNPEDYQGGNLQIMDENGKSYFVPRKKGTIIIFDSRANHRVLKVKSGVRKSLVCWVCGPRWK
jgi:PKHD-type hydroxylase